MHCARRWKYGGRRRASAKGALNWGPPNEEHGARRVRLLSFDRSAAAATIATAAAAVECAATDRAHCQRDIVVCTAGGWEIAPAHDALRRCRVIVEVGARGALAWRTLYHHRRRLGEGGAGRRADEHLGARRVDNNAAGGLELTHEGREMVGLVESAVREGRPEARLVGVGELREAEEAESSGLRNAVGAHLEGHGVGRHPGLEHTRVLIRHSCSICCAIARCFRRRRRLLVAVLDEKEGHVNAEAAEEGGLRRRDRRCQRGRRLRRALAGKRREVTLGALALQEERREREDRGQRR